MKIAVIHWYTSSVGGINTTLETLHSEAVKRGDTFHVFACDPKPTKKPVLYDSRTYVKGGDTSIKIDGELPYHDKNYKSSIQFLKDNKYTMFIRKVSPEFPDTILEKYIYDYSKDDYEDNDPCVFSIFSIWVH